MATPLNPDMTNEVSTEDVEWPRPLEMDTEPEGIDLASLMAEPDEPEGIDLATLMAEPDEPVVPLREEPQQGLSDSPFGLAEAKEWAVNTGERGKKFYEQSAEVGHLYYLLGKAERQGNNQAREEVMTKIINLPPMQESEGGMDKVLEVVSSFPATIFTGDRIQAGIDAVRMNMFNPVSYAPNFFIGMTGGYDADSLAGMTAATLHQVGVEPGIVRASSFFSGLIGTALGWAGIGKVAGALAPAVKREVTERVISSATAQVIAKSATGAVATGAVTAAGTMGAIEVSNIFFEELAKETNNAVYGTEFEHPSIGHMINRIKGQAVTGGILGLMLGGGAIAAGKGLRLLNTGKKKLLTREDSVDGYLARLKEKEKTGMDLNVKNEEGSRLDISPNDELTERLSFKENKEREVLTDELFKVPEENLDSVIERTIITRGGKDSGIPISEHEQKVTVLQEKLYELEKQLNSKESGPEEVVFELDGETPAQQRIDQPAPKVEGTVPLELIARQDAAKAAVKALDDEGRPFTDPEVMKATAEWKEASKAVREARKAGEEPKPNAPRPAGIVERKNRAIAREKELKEAGQKTTDPERAAAIKEAKVLKSLWRQKVNEKKALSAELKELEQMAKDPTVTGSEEALIRAQLAAEKAQELAEPGWLEPGPDVPEMTAESNKLFREKIREVVSQAKKAERQGDKNGLARGKALVRQMVDERRREQNITAERNKLIAQINDTIRKGAKKDGIKDADTTGIFRTIKLFIKPDKEALAGYLDGTKELPEGVNRTILEGLLRIRQDKRQNTLGGLRKVHEAVTELLELGTEKRFEQLLADEVRAVGSRRTALTELLGDRPLDQIKSKGKEVGDATTKIPRGPKDLFMRLFNKPGYFVTGNWMGIARILMRDMNKAFQESEIYKVFDSTQEERNRGVLHRELSNEVDSMLKTTYGENGTMTDKQLYDFKRRELYAEGQTILDAAGEPIYTVDEVGNKKFIMLNRFERIRHAADLDNKDIRAHFQRVKGYTDEMIAAIQNLDPQDQVMKELTLSFYRKTHGLKNEVFRRQNGYDLPLKESYAGTIHREGFDADMNVDPLLRNMGDAKPSASNLRSLMEATEGSDKPILIQNLLAGLESEASDTAHYTSFADKVDNWRKVLLDNEFIQGVNTRFDKQTAGEINNAILAHMKDIGRGRVTFETPTVVDFIRSNVVRGSLFGKAMVGIKQVNSFVNFAVENGMSAREFASGVIEALADPQHAMKVMDEMSPTIKARGVEGIDPVFTHTALVSRPPLSKKLSKLYADQEYLANKYLSMTIVAGDKASVYLGGYSLYRGLLKQVEAGKMTVEEAGLRVEAAMNRSQQTSEVSYQTPFQKSQNPVSKLASTFSTGVFSLMRMSHEAVFDVVKFYEQIGKEGDVYNTLREKGAPAEELAAQGSKIDALKARKLGLVGQTAKTMFVAHTLSGMLYSLASNYGVWDTEEMIAAGVVGPLAGVPFLGPGLESVVRGFLGLKQYPGNQDLATEVIGELTRATVQAVNGEPFEKWGKGLLAGAQMVTPVPLLLSQRITYSAANDLTEGELGRFLLTLTGASDKKVDKLTK